jgi:hypothetical protein
MDSEMDIRPKNIMWTYYILGIYYDYILWTYCGYIMDVLWVYCGYIMDIFEIWAVTWVY